MRIQSPPHRWPHVASNRRTLKLIEDWEIFIANRKIDGANCACTCVTGAGRLQSIQRINIEANVIFSIILRIHVVHCHFEHFVNAKLVHILRRTVRGKKMRNACSKGINRCNRYLCGVLCTTNASYYGARIFFAAPLCTQCTQCTLPIIQCSHLGVLPLAELLFASHQVLRDIPNNWICVEQWTFS